MSSANTSSGYQIAASPGNYAPLYKRLRTVELLSIVDSAEEFFPEAFAAAQKEIDERLADPERRSEANGEILAYEEEKRLRQPRVEDPDRYKGLVSFAVRKPITHEKFVTLTTLFFLFVFVVNLIRDWPTMVFIFEDYREMGLYNAIILTTIFIQPFSAILFWLRKKIGWVLLVAEITCWLGFGLLEFYKMLALLWDDRDSMDMLLVYVSRPQPVIIILTLVFSGAWFWTLTRKKMRKKFSIADWVMYGTVAGMAVVVVVTDKI